MTDNPPPYPGINTSNGYAPAQPSGAMGFTQPTPQGIKNNINFCQPLFN